MRSPKRKISVVIPALNEEHGLGAVLGEMPIAELRCMDYETEIVVVDNGSVDLTPIIALSHGATVVVEPQRGYGNAYKAGFAYATGDIVATGDADLTYPFSSLPAMVRRMDEEELDFLTTDRLSSLEAGVMCRSHVFGNRLLSLTARILFGLPFTDSQSGMWVFRRHVWDSLDVRSSGMPFSQELKIEAFVKGFRCEEVEITYRARAGKAKLSTIGDGVGNVLQMMGKRLSLGPAGLDPGSCTPESRASTTPLRPAAIVSDSGRREVPITWDERWFDPGDLAWPAPVGGNDPWPGQVSGIDAESVTVRRMVVWRPKRNEDLAPAPVAATADA